MKKMITAANGYKTLVKKIVREYEELEILVKNSVARGQWNVGKYIKEHLLQNKDRADYATGFFEKLAKDTGRDSSALQRAVQFYRAYPILAERRELNWNHYKGLMTVQDVSERRKLEEKIIRQNWNAKKLHKYLGLKRRLAAPVNDDNPVPQLKFTRGKLHTCRIVPANKSLLPRGPLALDLGFREQYAIPKDAPQLKEGDTVELAFRGGTLTGARKVEVPDGELFTYKAGVEKVIDGDTLLVSLDFGCPMSVSWKLRLRGIDCPEIDTEEGKKAKRFVEARLKGCEFIIVKTCKDRTDKFDRYLADIFYKAGASDLSLVAGEGTYLNQELLSEHFALAY
ncbi:MAG: thermonuclease family protein [Candidatus Omnitrophica bacterium]|nr:thermonuclease family protein [Candidatus Omnitrophota bacterium]